MFAFQFENYTELSLPVQIATKESFRKHTESCEHYDFNNQVFFVTWSESGESMRKCVNFFQNYPKMS